MKEYLIKDFTDLNIDKGENPTIQIVDEKGLWNLFRSLKEIPREIAIYEVQIGDCVLDWS